MIASREVGGTGLRVSRLGLGGAALGNLYREVSDEGARQTVEAALAAGIDFIDVAPFYGFGLAERRVGETVGGRDVTISTKAGRLLVPLARDEAQTLRDGFASPPPFAARFDYTGEGILRSHAASLERLGRDRVDLLLVHDIGARTHGAQAAGRMAELTEGGGLAALERLKHDGVISGWGLGVNETEVCLEVLRQARPDVILLAGRYTLLEQGALDAFFPAVEQAGTAVVIGGPFNSGVLAGADTYDYRSAPAAVRARVEVFDQVARRYAVPLPATALQFVLAHPAVVSVVPGARSPAEVRSNVAHCEAVIPAEFWRDLRDARLVAPDAPLPA